MLVVDLGQVLHVNQTAELLLEDDVRDLDANNLLLLVLLLA